MTSVAQAKAELTARLAARTSLVEFMKYTTPRWEPGKIHFEICRQLERVANKEVDRLLLLCPPQHGKSLITSKRFPAWLMGKDPTIDIISASATSDLATEFGGAVRDVVRSPDFKRLFSAELSESSQAKGRWETSAGGGYYAVGIGGALFGRGASLAVVDDPFSTWEDAQSKISRDRAWEWYRGTLYNRIRPGGSIVVIQHRTHEDDVVGHLLEEEKHGGDKWEIVKLIADMNDPPWVERYDAPALERIRDNTSPMMWSALYQQDPTPEDGDYFKKEWMNEYDEAPKNLRIYGASDYAVTDKSGDYTEHGVIGVDSSSNIYVLDWWYGQTKPDVWIDKKADLINQWSPSCWFGESGVIRRSVEPFMMKRLTERGAFCRIEWLASISDKEARARGIQGMMSMGKCFWPKHASWKGHVQESLLRFPAGKIDDPVDVMSLLGRGMKHVNASKRISVRRVFQPIQSWMGG